MLLFLPDRVVFVVPVFACRRHRCSIAFSFWWHWRRISDTDLQMRLRYGILMVIYAVCLITDILLGEVLVGSILYSELLFFFSLTCYSPPDEPDAWLLYLRELFSTDSPHDIATDLCRLMALMSIQCDCCVTFLSIFCWWPYLMMTDVTPWWWYDWAAIVVTSDVSIYLLPAGFDIRDCSYNDSRRLVADLPWHWPYNHYAYCLPATRLGYLVLTWQPFISFIVTRSFSPIPLPCQTDWIHSGDLPRWLWWYIYWLLSVTTILQSRWQTIWLSWLRQLMSAPFWWRRLLWPFIRTTWHSCWLPVPAHCCRTSRDASPADDSRCPTERHVLPLLTDMLILIDCYVNSHTY